MLKTKENYMSKDHSLYCQKCKPNKGTDYCRVVSHEEVEEGVDEALKGSPNGNKKIGWGKILLKLLNKRGKK